MEQVEKKMMTATRFEIEQQLNQAIGSIRANGLANDIKIKLVKLKIALSDKVKEIEEYRKTTIDSIDKPENFDDLKKKVNEGTATNEEVAEFNDSTYNKEIADILIPYLNEVVEIEFDGITEDEFWAIVNKSDVELIYGYEYLRNKLVK